MGFSGGRLDDAASSTPQKKNVTTRDVPPKDKNGQVMPMIGPMDSAEAALQMN